MSSRTCNLLLINPNTTESMTEKMLSAGRGVIASGTVLHGATATYGPTSIEGYYDEVFSIPPMLDAIRAHPPVDGVIVGCFDDTGVDAARSMIDAPVIGICQAAMQTAAVIANSFSVVTTLARSVPALEHLADRYGYSRQCRGVWASEVPVLALEDPASDALQKVRAQIEATLAHDRCEAIVLGCGGMSDLAMRLTADYGVPVIEGVTCAVKILEGLAAIGHKTAKRGGYATPRAKQYTGRFESYSPG